MSPRKYWAAVLTAAVIVSVAGNVGHSLLTAPAALRIPAAFAAALPPLALLGVTEGLSRSAGAGVRPRVYRAGVAGAVAIAALAFILSFAALRDLAIALGQPAAVAAGWPLLADATIAVASVMVLALKTSVAAPTADDHPATAPVTTPGHNGHQLAVVPLTSDITTPAPELVTAEALVRDGVVKAEPAKVAAAVAALAAGGSHRAVAVASGLHRTSVARVAEAVGAG